MTGAHLLSLTHVERRAERAPVIPSHAGRIVPPATRGTLPRPRLEEVLAEVTRCRLVLVTADTGHGKTSLLARWASGDQPGQAPAWVTATHADEDAAVLASVIAEAVRLHHPSLALRGALPSPAPVPGDARERAEALAVEVSAAIEDACEGDVVIVVDDAHEIGHGTSGELFLDALVRLAPARVHLVIASREPVGLTIARLRARGEVRELDAAAMRFTAAEVESVVAVGLGPQAPAIVERVAAVSGGWPGALRMAVDSVAGLAPDDRLAALDRVGHLDLPVHALVAEEVLPRLTPAEHEALLLAGVAGRLGPDVAHACGVPDAAVVLATLERRGLVMADEVGGGVVPAPMVAHALRAGAAGLTPGARRRLWRRVATAYEELGRPGVALAILVAAHDDEPAVALVERAGERPLRPARRILAVWGRGVPASLRSARLDVTVGRALVDLGEWRSALPLLAPHVAGHASAAFSSGFVAHLDGRFDDAARAYAAGLAADPDDATGARLAGWYAALAWVRGDRAECARLCELASGHANRSGEPEAVAVAETAKAMLAALDGDRRSNAAHYVRALAAAREAGDTLQIVRIQCNRASAMSDEGAYEAAVQLLDETLAMADLAGGNPFRSLALHNRGEALHRLGRLDEAVRDLTAARDEASTGRSILTYCLSHLADIHAEQGLHAAALAGYREALEIGRQLGDEQGLVDSLSGLADVLRTESPTQAEALAREAVMLGFTLGRGRAALVLGQILADRGAVAEARLHAAAGLDAGVQQRDRALQGRALALQARLADDDAERGRLLDEADALWAVATDPIEVARGTIARVELDPGADPALLDGVDEVASRLGARRLAEEAARVRPLVEQRDRPDLEVGLLGALRVVVVGRPVARDAWQSRRARDLLKLLALRRGAPVPRASLLEALWPGEADPSPTRLSVTMSTLRSVLDADKRFPADHFVCASPSAVWLHPDHVRVDLDRFWELAEEARQTGDDVAARPLLVGAERLYTGDVLEDDPEAEWADEARDWARTAYLAVVRRLARVAMTSGDLDGAEAMLLRLLARDPYDERAALALVRVQTRTGSHGEARRTYRRYLQRMAELELEPAPFPTREGGAGGGVGGAGRPAARLPRRRT